VSSEMSGGWDDRSYFRKKYDESGSTESRPTEGWKCEVLRCEAATADGKGPFAVSRVWFRLINGKAFLC
jgi:hypothetical protein